MADQLDVLDKLADGVSGLAAATTRAEKEARISRWVNMTIGALVCAVGAVTAVELQAAVRELRTWEARLSVWEERQVVHERRMSRALDVSQTVIGSLQGLIDAETARTDREKNTALFATERIALIGQAKAISAAIEDVKETEGLAKSERRPASKTAAANVDVLKKRLSAVKEKAAEKGHDLGE